MGGGERFTAFRDQRAELRPLQNMRHQGSQREHHLGSSRGRRRPKLFEYVKGFFTAYPSGRPIWRCSKKPRDQASESLLRVLITDFRKSAAVRRSRKSKSPKAGARSGRASRCCPYPGLQRRWTCPIRAVIASRAKQFILLNAAAPRAFVRQMESTVIL